LINGHIDIDIAIDIAVRTIISIGNICLFQRQFRLISWIN